eukprot:TRINITY_DN908_c0_g1_i2.p1 TRINITY_DN908_c0_g1~~TRINITY_DN908_c0_g1_i2.p1  ORF type:complete len:632 (-),score=105.07 TRINITY_DN908_c0_g1_i2:285-2180(-)
MAGAIHLGAFIFLSLLLRSFGHSYLAQPASRNLLQHVEGNEDCPHCLQGGGPGNVMKRGGGVWPTRLAPKSHGLCGDPGQGKPNPPTLADEKYLRPGHVVSVYQPGEIAEFHIVVSTHHQGHYEFRICDKALDGNALNSAAEGQACLDQWVLHRAAPAADCVVNDARGDCQPIDPKHPERWYLPPAGSQTQTASANWTDSMAPTYPSATETHVMRYKIPEALRCTHCTLQWYWSSGNTCLYDGDYFDYFRSLSTLGWSVTEWSPHILESWANCDNKCCHSESSPGAGDGIFGEEFWNCADIAVVQEGEPTTTTTTITTIVTTTTSTTTTSSANSVWEAVDGGSGRACRGSNTADNSASYYTLHRGVSELEDCKAKCIATTGCTGIEHSSSGRCEVWTRSGGIEASVGVSGYTCLRFQGATSTTMPGPVGVFDPVDGGNGRACRGESSSDNSADYYNLYRMVASLEDCKRKCSDSSSCTGIEFRNGRCEVWTKAIEATAAVSGYTCLRYVLPTTATTTRTTTTTTTTTATSTATAGCADVWDQCGGNLHTGPTCCVSGNYCFSQSEWYSQCVPNTADANSNTHLADIQKHSSVASDGHDKKTSKKFQKFLGTAFIQDQVSLKLEASAHFEEL